MAIIRTIPRKGRRPALTGRLMIDTVRGVLRVRKWPKKRGKPKSALQRFWVDWFRQANRLAKYADGMSQARAIEMTKGSGMYPRDVLLKAMRGRLYFWTTPDGWKWYSMAAIGDISESLDVLAQTVGDVLVRAADRWRAPPTGILGDVLTNKGPGNPAAWATPAGPGGIVQEAIAGTPIVPDNTVNSYDLDVSAYAQIVITLDGVGFAASDFTTLRLSTDGGITFHAGAADYWEAFVTKAADQRATAAQLVLANAQTTTGHNADAVVTNLRAGRCEAAYMAASPVGDIRTVRSHANFNGPITDIRLKSNVGNNFNAGTVRIVGLR